MALCPTFLLLSILSGISFALSTSEKQKILDVHNELRDRVAGGGLINEGHPAAKDMNMLIWDDGLAQLAQEYLDACPGFNHNPNKNEEIIPIRDDNPQGTKWGTRNGKTGSCDGGACIRVGENLAVSSNEYDIDQAVRQIETGWYDEYTIWTYGPSSDGCNPNNDHSSCGHYTAMIWANTRYVGCAWVNGCNTNWENLFICNYFPTGNMNGRTTAPYTEASSASDKASDCMSDRTNPGSSQYESVSVTRGDYNGPYNGLCGGGACATQCAGDSWSRNNCDECSTDTDCNDGTSSLSSGRDICDGDTGGSTGGNNDNDTPTSCPSSKPFQCKDGSQCIIAEWECDNYKDCDDNSDESNCDNNNSGDTTTTTTTTTKSVTTTTTTTTETPDNGDNDSGTCSDCVTVSNLIYNGDYCAQSSSHNSNNVYVNGDKALYYTGQYWYIWDWGGSVSSLDDDPNAMCDAYCGRSSLSSCDGNWGALENNAWVDKSSSAIEECSQSGGNSDNGNSDSGCNECYTVSYVQSGINKDYCAQSSTHNGESVYVNDDINKAVFYTGEYWYIWDWSGSINALDDDSNGDPDAYCGHSSLSSCDGNWYKYNSGDWTKKSSSSFAICGALEVIDCMDGYTDRVCMDAHDQNNTAFVFKSSVGEDEYMWQFSSCHNEKPMYYNEGYYLMYEQRVVYNETTDTKETLPFWIVYADEEYAYCNKEHLGDCTIGLWYKLLETKSFVGYEIDDTMGAKECESVAEEQSERKKSKTTTIILVVLLVFLVVIGVIAFCVYQRWTNTRTKAIVKDYAEKKTLAQNDQMKTTDTTGMLQEIEVNVQVED